MRIAVCQMLVSSDKECNLDNAVRLVKQAADNGAALVVLPEIFNAPYQVDLLPQYAEPIPGTTSEILSALAAKEGILLVGGSIPEVDAGGKIYNTCMVFDERGRMIGKHRKVHLFDVDIPGQMVFRESAVFTPGNQLTLIENAGLRIGVNICYDVRFPEMARLAALAGAKLLVIPAAFNTTTGPAHWDLLMRCRALDNQLYVIAASPARNPQASYQAWGHSMVVDPWGRIMCQAGEAEEIIYADLDLALLEKVRQELPVLKQRRTDVYELSPKH